jgi:dTDP-4-amino-4,6-dideoxygalactose transaminase
MRDTFLSFSPPAIGEEEIAEVVDTLRSDWITTGPKTRRFELEFRDYLGAPAALAVSSGTAALHTALVCLGIGPGDEVITSPLTFCSTVSAIEHTGARPVLVDVEPDTLNLDPAKVAEAVTPHTKGILPVHYGGHPCDMDALWDIANRHDLQMIEDAAHALPARYKGRLVGSTGNPVAFSFYATKNLTTAEGGMLTGSPELIEHAQVVSLHGMNRDAWKRYDQAGSWYYEVVMPGFKYNMTDIQAALGIWQLKKLAVHQQRRREIAASYNQAFASLEALELPVARPDVDHAWHLYPLRLRPGTLTIDRAEFIRQLTARNIGSSVHFIPIHLHPYFRDKYGYQPTDFPITLDAYERLLTIPLHPRLTDQDVHDVTEAISEIIAAHQA